MTRLEKQESPHRVGTLHNGSSRLGVEQEAEMAILWEVAEDIHPSESRSPADTHVSCDTGGYDLVR